MPDEPEKKPDPIDSTKQALFERDAALAKVVKLEREMKEIRATALGEAERKELETLRADQTAIDEKRKREAGQYDVLKQELVTKHAKELATAAEEAVTLRKQIDDAAIAQAFAGATSLFGGDEAKTILAVDVALAYFRPHIAVEANATGSRCVIVKNLAGQVIHGSDGNPAPFEQAMTELLDQHPLKSRLVRGSGKAGSGSAGGASGGRAEPIDTDKVTVEQARRDPKALDALRLRRAASEGLVLGRAFQKTGSS